MNRIVAIATMIALATATSTLADYQSTLVFGNSSGQDGIIGNDDRVPLEWDSVTGKKIVRLLDQNENFKCTGTVVGPSLILTAAHCLMINEEWRTSNKITYVETWDGKLSTITNRRVHTEWDGITPDGNLIGTHEFPWDVGLVFTSDEIADRTGVMWLIRHESGIDGPNSVELAAFHGDIDDRNRALLVREVCMAQFGTYVIRLNIWRVPHNCDVTGGSSGGPLLIEVGNGELAVAAINVASGFEWWHDVGHQNTGVRVDQQRGFVERWIQQNFEDHGWDQSAGSPFPAWW